MNQQPVLHLPRATLPVAIAAVITVAWPVVGRRADGAVEQVGQRGHVQRQRVVQPRPAGRRAGQRGGHLPPGPLLPARKNSQRGGERGRGLLVGIGLGTGAGFQGRQIKHRRALQQGLRRR